METEGPTLLRDEGGRRLYAIPYRPSAIHGRARGELSDWLAGARRGPRGRRRRQPAPRGPHGQQTDGHGEQPDDHPGLEAHGRGDAADDQRRDRAVPEERELV